MSSSFHPTSFLFTPIGRPEEGAAVSVGGSAMSRGEARLPLTTHVGEQASPGSQLEEEESGAAGLQGHEWSPQRLSGSLRLCFQAVNKTVMMTLCPPTAGLPTSAFWTAHLTPQMQPALIPHSPDVTSLPATSSKHTSSANMQPALLSPQTPWSHLQGQ